MATRRVTITDNAEEHRFSVVDEGIAAELVYRVSGDRLVLARTFTPPEHRGQGIAGQLVAAAAERARRTGETLVPSCWYARQWLEQNPTAVDGVGIEW